jgi:DNA-binding protein Fis
MDAIFGNIIGSVEKILIKEALERTNQNQAQAAQLLGLHRSTLRKKCKDHEI